MGIRARNCLLALFWLVFCAPAMALETDQFYAWGHPISDSSHYLNAWVQWRIQSVLDAQATGAALDCEAAVHQVQKHLQHSIYQPIEMWIISSPLVDQFPKSLEESRHYRSHYLLAKTFPFDFARWLQPSPTLQANGIRFGADKLAHFFSEGWWYYKWWKKHRNEYTEEELQTRLIEYGTKIEWWVQGMLVTGVISPADMEANYQGFLFYHQLCHGDQPLLSRLGERWVFSDKFDLRDYLSPEWDESWNANIYSKRRWRGVRSTMAGYCPQLHSEWLEQQRAHYRKLDTQTATEILIRELVEEGELPDPRDFDITQVCADAE